ncbi:hypothetical protein [Endozoicomonas sp. 2B-B]
MKNSTDIWHQRISASRRKREPWETVWQYYSRLHTEGKDAVAGLVDDHVLETATGDRVKVSLVYRNLEQTMAFLETPDIGITARATSATRELDNVDTHREAVVEQALSDSMKRSGLITGPERLDQMKLDGLICGHAISYSWWKVIEEEIEVATVPVLVESDGMLKSKIDAKTGRQKYEMETQTITVFEHVEDMRVSPMQFLFASGVNQIYESPWYGFESVVRLSVLKDDSRYDIPDTIEPSSFKIKNMTGEHEPGDDFLQEDSVKLIIVWDKDTRELIHFIETSAQEALQKQKGKQNDTHLVEIYRVKHPVRFDNPEDSPFNFFVPQPASDTPFGISHIEHIRNPAIEADTMRSRRADIAAGQKKLWAYNKNMIDPDQMEAVLSNDKKLDAVGVDIDSDNDRANLDNAVKEIQTAGVPDELLRYQPFAEDDVRKNSGIAETPFGGAETATESENQQMIGQARTNRKRNKLFKFLTDISRTHHAFLREFLPTGQSLRMSLPDGREEILQYGREALDGTFDIKVTPSGGPSALSPVRQKMLIDAIGLVQNLGPEAMLLYSGEALRQMDIRESNAILAAARRHLMGMNAPMLPGSENPDTNPNAINDATVLGSAVNTFG